MLGRHFELAMGEPIEYHRLAEMSRKKLTQHLHEVTWGMQGSVSH